MDARFPIMFTPEEIIKIHEKLVMLFPESLVLFGGSYLYNEATEDSDLDFYVISNFFGYKHKDKISFIFELKREWPKVKIMFLPRLFYKMGLYYIHGADINGAMFSNASRINRKIAFRNAMKLAYFHYLRAFDENDIEKKKRCVKKSSKQLAFALNLNSSLIEPLFSGENLRIAQNYAPADCRSVLGEIFAGNINAENFFNIAREYKNLLDYVISVNKKYLRFSAINYLIYNGKFLKKGDFRFLFSNPDKKILKKARNAKITDTSNSLQELGKIIFPIYIV